MTARTLIALFVLTAVAGFSSAAEQTVQQGQGHPFVCGDYSAGKVAFVSAEGKIEWEFPAPNCNDVWLLPNGNVLFVTGHGVKEVNRDKKVIFEHAGTMVESATKGKDGNVQTRRSPSEVYACQRLPDGNTFIGECSSGKLLEVDPSGKIVKEVRLLGEGKSGGHAFMRNARKLANGHYLVAHYGLKAVKEYDADGKEVWSCASPGGPHSVIRLPNGNTLIAEGDADKKRGSGVVEVDKDGKVVWEVRKDELEGVGLKFMTGLQRLPNGNTVMTNWLGHGNLGKTAKIIEVTPDKKVVWTFADHKNFRCPASIQLLDVKGDVTKGEILH